MAQLTSAPLIGDSIRADVHRYQFFRPLRGLVVFRLAVPTLARGATIFRPLRGLEMHKPRSPAPPSRASASTGLKPIRP
jgi:hypothetical protein